MNRHSKSRAARRLARTMRLSELQIREDRAVRNGWDSARIAKNGDSANAAQVLSAGHLELHSGRNHQKQGRLDRSSEQKSNRRSSQRSQLIPSSRVSVQRQYHLESQRPWICLLFVLPLILIYESFTLLGTGFTIRSGLDQWLAYFLNLLGFGQLIVLPIVTTAILLFAHHRRRDHWQVTPSVLAWMSVESVGLGLILFWAANAVYLATYWPAEPLAEALISSRSWWPQTIALIGSGIYEELVFRLILLTLATQWLFRWTKNQQSQWIAMLAVSLLFATAHYDLINPAGSPMEWSSFLFRFGASLVFSCLFLYRGFGIAVGTHVAFDLLTQL